MDIQLSIMLAFAAMLAWGIGDFLIQKATRKIGDVETLAVIGIVGIVAFFPFVIKDLPLLLNFDNIFWLVVLGIVTFAAGILNFEALKLGKLSIVDVVLELELPVTIWMGVVFLGESLTFFQYGVISLIFVGMVLIGTRSFEHFKAKMEKGVWIALIASFFMGTVNFLTATNAKNVSPMMAIWVPWVVFTVICLCVIAQRGGIGKLTGHFREYTWLLLWVGLVDTLAWIFYAFSVVDYEVAIITAITESYPAIALMLGVWLNKEMIRPHQWLGAGLALAASIILSFTV